MLTTLDRRGSPHVVWWASPSIPDPHRPVITTGGSQKAVNAERGSVAVLNQVDGARWLVPGAAPASAPIRSITTPSCALRNATSPRPNPRAASSSRCTSGACSARQELLDRGATEDGRERAPLCISGGRMHGAPSRNKPDGSVHWDDDQVVRLRDW